MLKTLGLCQINSNLFTLANGILANKGLCLDLSVITHKIILCNFVLIEDLRKNLPFYQIQIQIYDLGYKSTRVFR